MGWSSTASRWWHWITYHWLPTGDECLFSVHPVAWCIAGRALSPTTGGLFGGVVIIGRGHYPWQSSVVDELLCAREEGMRSNKRHVMSSNRSAVTIGTPADELAFIVIRACRSPAVSFEPQYSWSCYKRALCVNRQTRKIQSISIASDLLSPRFNNTSQPVSTFLSQLVLSLCVSLFISMPFYVYHHLSRQVLLPLSAYPSVVVIELFGRNDRVPMLLSSSLCLVVPYCCFCLALFVFVSLALIFQGLCSSNKDPVLYLVLPVTALRCCSETKRLWFQFQTVAIIRINRPTTLN